MCAQSYVSKTYYIKIPVTNMKSNTLTAQVALHIHGRNDHILRLPHKCILVANYKNFTCQFEWPSPAQFRLGEQRAVKITMLSSEGVKAVLDPYAPIIPETLLTIR